MMIAHFSDKPVSADVPSPFGPRCSGQSPSATRRGPCAATERQRHETTATGSHEFFSIATSSRRNRDSRKQLMHPPSAQVARRSVYTKAPEPLRPRDGAAEMLNPRRRCLPQPRIGRCNIVLLVSQTIVGIL